MFFNDLKNSRSKRFNFTLRRFVPAGKKGLGWWRSLALADIESSQIVSGVRSIQMGSVKFEQRDWS